MAISGMQQEDKNIKHIFLKIRDRLSEKLSEYFLVFHLTQYVRPHRGKILVMILLDVATAVLAMANPWLTKILIDQVYVDKDWALFSDIIFISAGLVVGTLLLGLISSYTSTMLTEKMNFELQKDMQKACSKVTYPFFQKRDPGEHIFRFTSDIEGVTSVLTGLIPRTVMVVSQLLIFSIIAFKLSPTLTSMFLAYLPFMLLFTFIKNVRLRPLEKELRTKSSDVNDFHSQYRLGILTTKIFAKEKFEERRLVSVLAERMRLVFERWRMDTRYESFNMLVGGGWNSVVILYGWSLVIQGELSLGALVALRMYLSNLSRPLQIGKTLFGTLIKGSVSAERVLETFQAEQEKTEGDKGIHLPPVVGKVTFEDVHFGYTEDQAVLKGVSFEVSPGSTVGITGPSGAGKTTLIHLLARLYRPDSGNIYIDGYDVGEVSPRALRQQLSIVSQEPFLFEGTVRDNIRYGYRTASDEEAQRAALAAQADEFIMNLDEGFDTVLGKHGVSLSVGQKQRVALARALLKNSPVLILDEFTASLDAVTEEHVCSRIHEFYPDTTIIIVSHKVSTLMQADEILVLHNGVIAENDTPEILLQQDGLFRKLYHLQSRFTLIQAEEEYGVLEKEASVLHKQTTVPAL